MCDYTTNLKHDNDKFCEKLKSEHAHSFVVMYNSIYII